MINKKDFDLLVTFQERKVYFPTIHKKVRTRKMRFDIMSHGGDYNITNGAQLYFNPLLNNILTVNDRKFVGMNVNKVFCNRNKIFRIEHAKP